VTDTPENAEPELVIDMRPDPDYWLALGEFIESFATAETVLFYHLARTAHVSANVSRVLFGAERASEYVRLIKELWDVESPPDDVKAELTDVLDQFGVISGTRNVIIHYASYKQYFRTTRGTVEGDRRVTSDGDTRVTAGEVHRLSTNVARALDPMKPNKARIVSAAIVRDMTADLLRINQQIMSHTLYPNAPLAVRAEALPTLRSAWRYRPQQVPRAQSRPHSPDPNKRA
jgi:hypothetical protein